MAQVGRGHSFPPIIQRGPTPGTVAVTLPETLAPTEGFLKSIDKLLADAVALTEARLLSVSKTVGDAVALAEAIILSVGKIITDAVGLTESLQAEYVAGASGILTQRCSIQIKIGIG